MKKITRDAANAFFSDKEFRRDNTSVRIVDGHTVIMRLYDTDIAIKDKDGNIFVRNGGFQTNTTKERLNGITDVRQKNHVWYLNGKVWDGLLTKI